MRWSIVINQPKALEWELNVIEAAVFNFFYELHSWAEAINIGNDTFYYYSKGKIAQEIPLITTKPDTTYRHVKKLAKIGLIKTIKIDNKDYACVIGKGKTWNEFPNGCKSDYSEKNPKVIGKKSDSCSEKNPTNNNTNSIRKPNNKFKSPSESEVISFFVENGQTKELAKKAFNHYELGNWHDANGKPVKNWKQKMHTNWFQDKKPLTKQQELFAPASVSKYDVGVEEEKEAF